MRAPYWAFKFKTRPLGETRKFQKIPPIGREGVYDENSDLRGKKTNRMEKNIKYI
jgi:hypothetical protein